MALNKILSLSFIIWVYTYLRIASCDEACERIYVMENKSYNRCELNQHLNEPSSEFRRGDYYELFDMFEKQSYTLISIKHQATDGQDATKYIDCFFCISFYNVSSGEYEIQDKLMLDYNKKTESLNKIWEGKREYSDPRKPDLISYDIGSKSGKTTLCLK